MDKRIGFIGCGNMGRAILEGLLSSGLVSSGQITASAGTQKTLDLLSSTYGICTASSNLEAARASDLIFLAVKPYLYDEVLREIKDAVGESTILIAIAAGITISHMESLFLHPVKIIRAMPNTPAMAGAGMTAVTPNTQITSAEEALALTLFESFGKAELVPESLMDAVTGVSGSSPAYVYMFIEAMADAAVADGMPRPQAYKFAAQSVLGAAKMVLDTGKHPGELKDAVCSPGGTTIAAVAALEKEGLRSAVITAQRSCVAKSREMTRNNK